MEQDVSLIVFFFFQAEDGIRDLYVTGVQTCALPISRIRTWQCDWVGWTSRILTGVPFGTISSLCEAIRRDSPTSSLAASSFSLSVAVSSSTDTNVNDSGPSPQTFATRPTFEAAVGAFARVAAFVACSTLPINR